MVGPIGMSQNREKNANLLSENFTICKTSIGHNSVKNEAFGEIFFSRFLRIDRCTHSYQAITKKPQKSPLIKDVVYGRYHSALRTQLRRWYFSEMLREGLLQLDQDIKTLVLAEFGTAKAEKRVRRGRNESG